MTVKEKFDSYPKNIRLKLTAIRKLVYKIAKEEKITDLEETLKWGQISYLCKTGSTIRMDWLSKEPDKYALYFNCKSKLIETCKELYPNLGEYSGNRQLTFELGKAVPEAELRHCLILALTYHKVKHLPLLGA